MVLPQMAAAANRVAPLSPHDLARARDYLYGGLIWGTLAQLWLLALLAWFWFSRQTRRWHHGAPVAATRLFASVLVLLLPFDFYLGWWRERAFGFQNMSAPAWLGQWALSSLVTILVGIVVVFISWAWLRRRSGPAWWLRLWIVVSLAALIGVALQPIALAPLFNHYQPIQDPAIRAQLTSLAQRAGIPNARIEQMDASRQSAHTNAFVVGILGSQRIVVYDTLLSSESPAEISFTVGHEIGHYVLHHIWKGLAFTVVLLLAFFAILARLYPRWASGTPPSDIAALPLILFILLGLLFLASPATNGFSRWEEHQADAFGLRLSHQPCAAAASFEREEHTDLIYPDPPHWIVWWFFNHPSQAARVYFSRTQCRQSTSVPVP